MSYEYPIVAKVAVRGIQGDVTAAAQELLNATNQLYLNTLHAANIAQAASDAAGVFASYDTVALATAAIGSIPNGKAVEIYFDENHLNHRTRYQNVSGTLVFKIDLTLSPLPDQFGASVSGTNSANLAAFNAMFAALTSTTNTIDLGGNTYHLSAEPTNFYGIQCLNGSILIPSGISTFETRYNIAYTPGKLVYFTQHMSLFNRKASARTVGEIRLNGDSKTAMTGYPVKAEGFVRLALNHAGYNHIDVIVNAGVSGTSISDLDPTTMNDADTILDAIGFGTNDAVKSNPVYTYLSTLDAKIAQLRALPNGVYTKRVIVLWGPNATFRPSQNQDPKWYEQIIYGMILIARKYSCVFVDRFSWEPDRHLAAGFTGDSIAPYGESLHDDAVEVYHTYLLPWVLLLDEGVSNIDKSNWFFNIGRTHAVANPTAVPAAFFKGHHQYEVLTTDGWPLSGLLVVERGDDGQVTQTITTLDIMPRVIFRSGGVISGAWTQWAGKDTLVTSFTGGWGNKGAGYSDAGWTLGLDGFVQLFGVISGGASGSSAFTIPSNLAPQMAKPFFARNSSGGSILIGNDGLVTPTTSDVTLISLEGIRYKADI